jgi:hypothetical protein
MSINSMTNVAAARRPDVGAPNAAPATLPEIAAAAGTEPQNAPPAKQQASGIDTALKVIFGYIPTEIVTLYVAVSAALQPAAASTGVAPSSPQALWIAFLCFLVGTPLVVWVVFAGKLTSAGKPLPASYASWPLWEMVAASLAFCAWAFALPNTPFREFSWYSPALAALAVTLASTVLGLIAPLFVRKQLGT